MADFFSSNLKYLREQRKMSQSELARRIGVNQTTIARWEEDNRIPTINNAVDVSSVLNINLEDLLGIDLRFNNKNTSKGLYSKTITDEDGYSIEIKTEVPFNELSKEKQQDMIDTAMEKLFEVKKEIKENKK